MNENLAAPVAPPPDARQPESMYSPADFCRYLKLGSRTFATWRAAGKVPPPDLAQGRILRWRRSTIEQWLDQQREGRS